MEQFTSIQQIAFQLILILGTIVGAFVWAFKKLANYFISKINEKDEYIVKLIAEQHGNTVNFIETINHQRTKDREVQEKSINAINQLTNSINIRNQIDRELISFLKNGRKHN